jgi:O-antigen/teichoic acid export membrane protein
MSEEGNAISEGVPDLRRRALKGLAWSGGSQVVSLVGRTVVAITLARLLAPDDYGLAALVLVFASLVLVFADLALGAAIIQRPVLTEDDRSTAFWLSAATGLAFMLLGVAAAQPLAYFYGRAEVAPLCMALSTTFFIGSLGTTQEALLVREMDFGSLERRSMVATIIAAVVGITVAVTTRSPWAIITQQIAETMVSTTLLWKFSPWRPSLRFSRRSLREMGGFSSFLVGHRLLYYAHRNADNLLIGKFVGAAALGAYTLAYNIMLFPFTRIAGSVQKVLGPAFARMQNDKPRLADSWIRAVRLLATAAVPLLFGIAVVAPDFVAVVLGSKWAQTAPILQVLAWVGLIQSLQSLNTDVLQALGLASRVFRFTIIFTTSHLVAFVVGLHWGVIGVAAGYAISTTLVEPIYTVMTARAVGISPLRILAAVRGVVEAGVLMAVTVFVARELMLGWGVPTLLRLVACVAVGGVAFLPAYLWRERAGSADIRGILTRARRSRPSATVDREVALGEPVITEGVRE